MIQVPEAPPARFLEVTVPVRFGDTDPYGVVYFASYFRYCHHGIEELLRHLGLPPQDYFRNRDKGFGLPIVGASCDFLKPVRYGDTLRLRVSVLKLGRKSVIYGFHFYPEDGGGCVARGHAAMVAIDRTWRSCELPDAVREALGACLC